MEGKNSPRISLLSFFCNKDVGVVIPSSVHTGTFYKAYSRYIDIILTQMRLQQTRQTDKLPGELLSSPVATCSVVAFQSIVGLNRSRTEYVS